MTNAKLKRLLLEVFEREAARNELLCSHYTANFVLLEGSFDLDRIAADLNKKLTAEEKAE